MPRLITQSVVADFRERLCDVAALLFSERGRDGFNMRELAKRLRVSPMTAYRYFRDKDEILSALRARAFAGFAARLESALAACGGDRSTALALAYARFLREEEVNYRLMFDLFQPAIPAVPELAVAERRARAAINAFARLMVEDGTFDGEPETIGMVFWSALHGAAALHLAAKLPPAELDRLLPEAARALAVAYRGARTMNAGQWPAVTVRPAPDYAGLTAAE